VIKRTTPDLLLLIMCPYSEMLPCPRDKQERSLNLIHVYSRSQKASKQTCCYLKSQICLLLSHISKKHNTL